MRRPEGFNPSGRLIFVIGPASAMFYTADLGGAEQFTQTSRKGSR